MAKKTALYQLHCASHAQMVEFAGWSMPLFFTGILDEHETVRQRVGLFDVSHMGEIEVRGKDALPNLQRLLTADVAALSISQVKYGALCYPEGTVIDDLLIYRLGEDRFLLCVNASNTEKDYHWILENLEGETEALDSSSDYAQLAVQGPRSAEVLQRLTASDLTRVGYYRWIQGNLRSIPALISRTGYTGEDGFEIFCPPDCAPQIWEWLMKEGKPLGIQSIGLGARDTLRLEMAFPLYGHELGKTHTFVEAGLGRFVDWRKDFFIGQAALARQKAQGVEERLIGLAMKGEGVPREGYAIHKNGAKIGVVTSGNLPATQRKGIGLGYVAAEEAWPGNEISILIRGKAIAARIVKKPFYKREKDRKTVLEREGRIDGVSERSALHGEP